MDFTPIAGRRATTADYHQKWKGKGNWRPGTGENLAATLLFLVLFNGGLERLQLEFALFVLHQQLDFLIEFGQFLIAEFHQADPFF